MKVVKINQLDSSIEEFTVNELDKKTFDFVPEVFGFEFSEEDLRRKDLTLLKNDIECMEFTIRMIKDLQEQGVIEVEE